MAPARSEAKKVHFAAQLLLDPAVDSRCHAPAEIAESRETSPKTWLTSIFFKMQLRGGRSRARTANLHPLATAVVVDRKRARDAILKMRVQKRARRLFPPE